MTITKQNQNPNLKYFFEWGSHRTLSWWLNWKKHHMFNVQFNIEKKKWAFLLQLPKLYAKAPPCLFVCHDMATCFMSLSLCSDQTGIVRVFLQVLFWWDDLELVEITKDLTRGHSSAWKQSDIRGWTVPLDPPGEPPPPLDNPPSDNPPGSSGFVHDSPRIPNVHIWAASNTTKIPRKDGSRKRAKFWDPFPSGPTVPKFNIQKFEIELAEVEIGPSRSRSSQTVDFNFDCTRVDTFWSNFDSSHSISGSSCLFRFLFRLCEDDA